MTTNYAKGHGHNYQQYIELNHPGKRYILPTHVIGGSRQDSSFEGVLPVYNVCEYILQFLNKQLKTRENILQNSLFISLGSMEVLAHLPMCWLAGKTHELVMGKALDSLHNTFTEV